MRAAIAMALLAPCLACSAGEAGPTDAGIPPAARLLFDCRSKNIGVLADINCEFTLACDAAALDSKNVPIANANIRFLEEAGLMERSELDESDESPRYVYRPRDGARMQPKDVAPFPGEPSLSADSRTRNPRDMLVTLVAYVEGDNPQAGDMFSGDPFVDLNDNQQWDPDEPFVSANGSDSYSPSQSTLLWKQLKVLWTGRLSQSPAVSRCEVVGSSGSSVDIARGQSTTFSFTLLDDYFNVLASNDTSDAITWALEPFGLLDLGANQPASAQPRLSELGMELDAEGNFPVPTTETSFRRQSRYSLKVTNAVGVGLPGDYDYSVSGTVERYLTIDEAGWPSCAVEDELPKCTGKLQ